jgi:putative transcriptional regulator
MIKHHPKFELIDSFVKGELPASLAAGISIHAEMCPTCQLRINQLTEQMAESSFEQVSNQEQKTPCSDSVQAIEMDIELDQTMEAMLNQITESAPAASATIKPNPVKTIKFRDQAFILPRAIQNMPHGKPTQLGKLTRARLQLNENEIHSSLLHIEPGGSVPEHTHKGFELTVLLAGSFSDEQDEYVKGDFIMLDKSHQHQPQSAQGCLCYTVANDALHFTKGINKLLNPIGSFIY